jgi:hypothetical protein
MFAILAGVSSLPGLHQHQSSRSYSLDPPLSSLFPRGLPAGCSVAVCGASGSITMATKLAAALQRSGARVALVGYPDLCFPAAANEGMDPSLTFLLPRAEASTAKAVSCLLEGLEVVVVPAHLIGPKDMRLLLHRALINKAVLITTCRLDPPPADYVVRVRCLWGGLGQGCGVLSERKLEVSLEGRRVKDPRRSVALITERFCPFER